MKRRTHPAPRGGVAPYTRYDKHPFNYGAMYARNPHLRRPGQEGKVGTSSLPSLLREEDIERIEDFSERR